MENNKTNKFELSTTVVKPSANGSPPASYKAIPEKDMEDEITAARPKSLVKAKSVSPERDGADEKMLPEKKNDAAANNMVEMVDVKISPNSEKQNGDVKLDIGEVKAAFVGLTKEELMKYANDPFWVRLRWFLFVTFWLLWAAMLFGAIMIIYAAPKCNPPPPRTWWQQGPLSEIQHEPQIEELKSLKEKGVQGVIVRWPEDTYETIEQTHEFAALLKKAKDEDINVIVELEPGNSTRWFDQSANKHPVLTDYYIWRAPKSVNSSGVAEPPNNWKTIRNESSWVYSDTRKEFYYAPTGTPMLNFRNPTVISEFSEVLKKVLDLGARGIRLKNVPLLLVDPKFEDEAIKNTATGFIHTDYGFFTHTKTENHLDLAPLLHQWKLIVNNKTENNGPLMASDELGNVEAYRMNGSLVIDLPLEARLFIKPNVTAPEFVKAMTSIFAVDNVTWPLWKYNSSSALDIVTFLLPGAPLIRADVPINSELLKLRGSPSIMRGSFSYHSVANNTVFAFNRVTSGNPGVLVAYNPTDQRAVVDFPAEIPAISEEVTVQLFSTNYTEPDIALNVKEDAHSLPVSPYSAIVLTYVPRTA